MRVSFRSDKLRSQFCREIVEIRGKDRRILTLQSTGQSPSHSKSCLVCSEEFQRCRMVLGESLGHVRELDPV